ncbi:MAG: right-handed parallel beta-helix repeat-containing protein, partial [Lentisphaeria bacterium]|nr:right-handed parallel beta-helix repeat-containing protein [Lentisphaeria bacterium]
SGLLAMVEGGTLSIHTMNIHNDLTATGDSTIYISKSYLTGLVRGITLNDTSMLVFTNSSAYQNENFLTMEAGTAAKIVDSTIVDSGNITLNGAAEMEIVNSIVLSEIHEADHEADQIIALYSTFLENVEYHFDSPRDRNVVEDMTLEQLQQIADALGLAVDLSAMVDVEQTNTWLIEALDAKIRGANGDFTGATYHYYTANNGNSLRNIAGWNFGYNASNCDTFVKEHASDFGYESDSLTDAQKAHILWEGYMLPYMYNNWLGSSVTVKNVIKQRFSSQVNINKVLNSEEKVLYVDAISSTEVDNTLIYTNAEALYGTDVTIQNGALIFQDGITLNPSPVKAGVLVAMDKEYNIYYTQEFGEVSTWNSVAGGVPVADGTVADGWIIDQDKIGNERLVTQGGTTVAAMGSYATYSSVDGLIVNIAGEDTENNADKTSLREAIENAIANGGGTITFAEHLDGETIIVSEMANDSEFVGLILDSDVDITIKGAFGYGADEKQLNITIAAFVSGEASTAYNFQLFDIQAGSLTLDGITLTHYLKDVAISHKGDAVFAEVSGNGSFIMSETVISDVNAADASILTFTEHAGLDLYNVAFTNNNVQSIVSGQQLSNSVIKIDGTSATQNTVRDSLFKINGSSQFTLINSTIYDNDITGSVVLSNGLNAQAQISDTQIYYNRVTNHVIDQNSEGGSMMINRTLLASNKFTDAANGGYVIHSNGANLLISDSTIANHNQSDGSSYVAGGVYYNGAGNLNIINSTIADQRAHGSIANGAGLLVDHSSANVKVLNSIILGNNSTDGENNVWNASDIIVKNGVYNDAYTLSGKVILNGTEIESGKETGVYSYYGLGVNEVFDNTVIPVAVVRIGAHAFRVNNNGVLTFDTSSLAYRNGIQVECRDGKVYYGGMQDPFITLADVNAFKGNYFQPLKDQTGAMRTSYTAVGAWNGSLTQNIFLTTEYRTKKEAVFNEYGEVIGYNDVEVDWYVEGTDGKMKFNCAGFEYYLPSAHAFVDMKGWRVETPGRLSTFTVRAGDTLNINEGPAIEIGSLIVEGSQVIAEDDPTAPAR